MSDFQVVAQTKDVPESGKLCLEVDDRFVVIIRVGDSYFCVDDVCTHDGGPLGEGELRDFCLVCPRHGAEFDVRTGEAVTMPATEPTASHQVKVDGDDILIKLAS